MGHHLLLLTALMAIGAAGASILRAAELPRPSDYWVATDALGRKLPTHAETGDRRPGKYVGVFYFVWTGIHTEKVYDISKILQAPEPQRQWGPKMAMHFWTEPEYGYFHSWDPWVIRRDMQMLVNADVDFIFVDATNAVIYEKTVAVLLKVIRQMRAEGIPAPAVVFTTNAKSGQTINRLYDQFYKDGAHADLWLGWDDKPLILGHKNDPELRPELRDYFTIKYSWAWTAAKSQPDHWQWIDTYPQDYGWSASPDKPEQIPVAAASHATNNMGKSFHNGKQPEVHPDYTTDFSAQGLHFEEQWKRAHQVDPQVVMITGWNEWIASRFIKEDQTDLFAGRPPMKDGTWFVDQYSAEFNRDCAPMRGGYTDTYYYQMISHIRRFKGLAAPPQRPEPREIQIDGKFDQWQAIPAVYRDPSGDTMHRNFRGTDPKTIYTNAFGRNDITEARVVEGLQHVYFLATTAANLTPHTDPKWMMLLIDTDQNTKTGWEGYDLLVNSSITSATESQCARWIDGKWQPAGTISHRYQGKHLELAVPNSLFPRQPGDGFDFKWADNVSLTTGESLFLEGDVAPDRRFNFRY